MPTEDQAMTKPSRWFLPVVILALLWNLAGLAAVIADLRLSPAQIAALPAPQQALYAARPFWSVLASLLAVVGGTLGCALLLVRRKEAFELLAASLGGVVLQDLGIFVVAGGAKVAGPVPFVLQGLVLLIAVGLLLLARSAARRSWLG